jgi:hypothetical protein
LDATDFVASMVRRRASITSASRNVFALKLMLLRATTTAVAIAIAFGLIVFLTVRHGQDCRSPQRSISIGGAVLMAGCANDAAVSGR